MSVDSGENNVSSGWGQSTSTTNYSDNAGTNQWLVSNSDKMCGSWAQAVSGDSSTSNSSNIPNQSVTNKLNTSNQSDLIADDNGSQTNQNLVSSHFSFDELDQNDLYSTKWGKSVINHDNAWDLLDLSPSSANNQNSTHASTTGFKSAIDQQLRNNNGTELWENNLRQTKELQGCCTSSVDMQSSNQQPIDQQQLADNQWSKLGPQQQQATAAAAVGHGFGGVWGEEEDLTNVWTGVPNNSLTNQVASQMNVNSTSASNVFNNRQPNSINCDKSNLQLLSNNNSNKNWISDWGESIKTGNEWDNSGKNWDITTEITMMNASPAIVPKGQQQEGTENWNFYQSKLNSALPNNQGASWSGELESKQTILNDSDIDNGTSLWGNPQGQNKVLLWKDSLKEENKRNNETIINNVEQWKKYSLNGNQINNGEGNWNELLIEGNVPGTSNMAWNAENQNSADDSDWAKNKRKLTKEMIASSSQFRILVEMGFKEDDVESSLRNTNLNLQESIEELRLNTLKETGVEIDRRKQQAQNSPIQGLPSVNNMLRNNATTGKLPNQPTANLPSEKLLSHLVQQIQLAVQTGHLNAQILNQQLAPSTITLIYQLLQQIKIMQSLQGGVSKNYFQNSYQVSQCKQKIASLQKQINVQQALLFKQQQMQTGNRPTNTANNQMLNNSIGNNLANDLSNLQLNQQNQSRLNQWKLPSSNYDKDDLNNYEDALTTTNDFSRAPGPSSSKPSSSWLKHAMASGCVKTWQQQQQQQQNRSQLTVSAQAQQLMNPNNNYGEMVSDFTNKQWKDTMQQMNNNAQTAFCNLSGDVKEQMYNWSANKLVDNDNLANVSNAFNSSTWTFSNSNQQVSATPQNANIWNNNQSANTASNNNKPKGPPPGLGQVQQQQQQKDPDQNSSFLLIRNLTIQMDESILKTLCRQHGSLLFFHLFQSHGLAIVKYSSKEETIKAQSALNNCPLGNTSIQVQVASESEVQQYLANCQIATNTTSAASSMYTGGGGNDYMIAANNGAWNNGASNLANSSNMWSFSQSQPNNLWNNIDQNSNNPLQNL